MMLEHTNTIVVKGKVVETQLMGKKSTVVVLTLDINPLQGPPIQVKVLPKREGSWIRDNHANLVGKHVVISRGWMGSWSPKEGPTTYDITSFEGSLATTERPDTVAAAIVVGEVTRVAEHGGGILVQVDTTVRDRTNSVRVAATANDNIETGQKVFVVGTIVHTDEEKGSMLYVRGDTIAILE